MENVTAKNNEVGDLYQVNLESTKILNIFTKAGGYRGGRIYSEDTEMLEWFPKNVAAEKFEAYYKLKK